MFGKKKIFEYDVSLYNRHQYKMLRDEIKNGEVDEQYQRRVADPKNSESKMRNLIVVYKMFRLDSDMNDYLFDLDNAMALTIVYIARAFTHGITKDEITRLLYERAISQTEACMNINVYIKQHSRGLDKTYLKYATFDDEDIDSGIKGVKRI